MKKATALKYDPEKGEAPIITATGKGVIAENIIQTARDSAVPIVTDKLLAESLAEFSPGSEITRELYEAVAQVMVFIADRDREYRPLAAADEPKATYTDEDTY